MSIRVKLSKTKSSLEALHSVAILTMHSINNNNNCPQSGLLGTLRLMCIVRNDIRLPRTFCWVANKMCNHECCLTVLTSNHFLQSPIMHSIHIEVIKSIPATSHQSEFTSYTNSMSTKAVKRLVFKLGSKGHVHCKTCCAVKMK